MSSLISDANKVNYELWIDRVFDTFKRPFTLYIEAQVAYISTNPSYSPFGEHDQDNDHPPVTPQSYTVYGCILYPNKQPWEFVAPENRANFEQNKLRNSFGQVRLKLDPQGYALMAGVKLVNVDGFNFKLTTNAAPKGLFVPSHFVYYLDKVD